MSSAIVINNQNCSQADRRADEILQRHNGLSIAPDAQAFGEMSDLLRRLEKVYSPFEDRSLDFLERLAEKERTYLGHSLALMDSSRAWAVRENLIEAGLRGPVAEGLAGLDNEQAWEMRERIIKYNEKLTSSVVVGLCGVTSERAMKFRHDHFAHAEKHGYFGFLAWSLAGDDSDAAWDFRKKLKASKIDLNYYIRSVGGLDSDRAWELRDEMVAVKQPTAWLLEGLAGCESDRAWDLRESLVKNGSGMEYISLGLATMDHERAWDLRDRMRAFKPRPPAWGLSDNYYIQGLAGCDSDRAWAEREKYFKTPGLQTQFQMRGVSGDWIVAAVKAGRKEI